MHLRHFKKLSVLGEGSTSITFLAKPTTSLDGLLLNDLYALRMHKGDTISSSIYQDSLLRESHNLQHIQNHKVAKQLFWCKKELFSVLKAYSGLNLYQWRQFQNPTDQCLVQFIYQMLHLLNEIHEKNVVHGDVKPHNILVENGQVILCDLFASHNIQEDYQQVKNFCGTIRYASPEYIKAGFVSSASDYYSLGMTLFFMVTNFEPIDEWSTKDVFIALRSVEVHPYVMQIFRALLEDDPCTRLKNVSRLRNQLESLIKRNQLQSINTIHNQHAIGDHQS